MKAKKPKTTSFVVDRAKWFNGKTEFKMADSMDTEPDSQLRERRTGMQCCLGFVARQLGVSARAITGIGRPADIAERLQKKVATVLLVKQPDEHWFGETNLTTRAIQINDSDKISNTVREKKLIALFKKHGYRIRFTGKYPDGPIKVKP